MMVGICGREFRKGSSPISPPYVYAMFLGGGTPPIEQGGKRKVIPEKNAFRTYDLTSSVLCKPLGIDTQKMGKLANAL